jgi:threonine synthase
MTTKVTTIYQTSPKNSAMTTYTFENHLKSPKSTNNPSQAMVSLVCPQCKGYFKYNMPNIAQVKSNHSQDSLLKKQKELIDEISNLKFEMNSWINEQ